MRGFRAGESSFSIEAYTGSWFRVARHCYEGICFELGFRV